MRDPSGSGRLVKMQLTNAEVHIQQAVGDIFTGFSNADDGFIADEVAPIVLMQKQSDKFWTTGLNNAFDEAVFAPGGNQAGYNEINPTFSNKSYSCVEYPLGAFLPTQLEANADATLDLAMQYAQKLAVVFKLREETAIATKMQTAANYDASLVVNVGGTAANRWLDTGTGLPGASSDPVKDLQDLMIKSVMPITHAIMNERVYNAFFRHPKVQAYTQFKDGYAPFGSIRERFATLNLPVPVLAKAKKNPLTGSALPDYIWSSNHVSLIRRYEPSRIRSGTDTANLIRFRWSAGYERIPGATVVNGMASRLFFNPYRGYAGGTQMVMMLAQDEFVNETKVGGLLQGVVT